MIAAAKAAQQMRQQEKSTTKKICLILNIITPENKERKFKELKNFIFSNKDTGEEFKTKTQCFEENIDWDEELHCLTDEKFDIEILKTVVEIIIRKA